MLEGLEAKGPTAALRRAALQSMDDDALAAALQRLAVALRGVDVKRLASNAGLPTAEVGASPFALRAVAMGVEVGAVSRHRELRAEPDWTERLAPPEVRDPNHDVWDRGVLRTGKYQGFMAEAPFATYDPSHVSKWGPHEMMHRAAGFFFRPDFTRWELYLGARLNELVPVVLFYGPEQAMRLEEGAFDRAAAGRSPSARSQRAMWRLDDGALAERARAAVPIFREGLAHFERELAAIDREIESHLRVRVPHPVLDASSDATAYVVGHEQRLSAPEVQAVLSAVPAFARFDTLESYRAHVETVFDRLLFAPLEAAPSATRQAQRLAWDRLLRAATIGVDVEDHVACIASGEDPAERLRADLVEEELAVVLEDGAQPCLRQLSDGLGQVAPCALALLGDGAVEAFAVSDAIWDRAPLAQRFAAWVEPGAARSMATFEAAIVVQREDDAIERLTVPAEALPGDEAFRAGWVVPNVAAHTLALPHDVLSSHADFAEGEHTVPVEAPSAVCVTAHRGEVAVIPLPACVADALSLLEDATSTDALAQTIDASLEPEPGWPKNGLAWVRELLLAGALGWRPRR
ncbi:MAG: hypothetical protein AB8I08_33690 [Sandaracinaceae bacterium]